MSSKDKRSDDRLRALVVDDSQIMRQKIVDILENNDVLVIGQARNGAEALNLYKTGKPDFVTMDITMEQVDGIEATRKIVDFDPDAQVMIVSALNHQERLFKAIQAGARGSIVKPFDEDELIDAINAMFD